MPKRTEEVTADEVSAQIFEIRGQRVILDAHLAALYGVETKRLNEQVHRNKDRFPDDFAFRLTGKESLILKSQFATSSMELSDAQCVVMNRPQNATGSRHGGKRKLPLVFTEHGALMAANVIRSPKAVEMSVFVVRAFVKMREQLGATRELARRLAEVENGLLVHDSALVDLYDKIRPLLLPPEEPPKKQIGFSVRERRAKYTTSRKNKHALRR
jgi:hypothetical protein